ncbi:MAG: GNAT family N-acetyltransferase [Chloroflexi bacterium]|nr:GNAT family N-acetyltransferase [Chloroflexota bacterium]
MKLVAAPESWAGLRDDWAALVRQLDPPAGVFADPDFPAAWAHVFAADEQLEPYAVRDATGTLVGVLPVRFRDGVATFIGDPEICDYMDMVAAPGAGPAVADALLALLDERGCGAAEIRGLAEGSPTLEALPAAARRQEWTVRSAQEAVCPVVTLPARWESYLDGLKGKNRHEVRRKLRHLADGGARVALEAEAAPQGMGDALESLFTMMRDSRRDKAEFLDDRRAAFFRELVRRFGPRGLARLYFLLVDGRRVAAMLTFETPDEVMAYNSGYDPAYRDLAVGLASKVYLIRHSIERGARRFNFLRGNEEYKMQLGGVPSPVTRLHLERGGA